jgi:hypothetical protein
MSGKLNCDWCGVRLDEDEGPRLLQPQRNLGAAFCRLEHVVPWLMQKNDWHILPKVEVPEGAAPVCAQTGADLEEDAYYLVSRRDGTEVADGFINLEAVLAWAKAGGRYAPG